MKNEYFTHKNKRWTRLVEEPYSCWVVGVDLGKRIDYTAVSVIEHTRVPIPDDWKVDEAKQTITQKVTERFTLRGLQRLPLGMDYPIQAERITELLSRPPLRGYADMVVDDTGVGAPVADEFEKRWAVKPVRVTLTGTGLGANRLGPRRFTVPKNEIVSHLDAQLNNGSLIFAEGLSDSEALRDELANFQQHISAAGRPSFEARGSAHDDIVLSIGLALWWAIEKRKRNRFHVGPVRGLY